MGLATEKVVTFACTLQKENLGSKTKSDTKSIVESGLPVDSVNVFCIADMPVSKRHDIQKCYFSRIQELYWPSEFEDAVVLATYCQQAQTQKEVELAEEEVALIRTRLRNQLDAQIDRVDNASTRCGLLEIQGYLEFNWSMFGVEGFNFDRAFDYWIDLLHVADASSRSFRSIVLPTALLPLTS